MTRTRCRSCPGRTATLLRCCAEPGSTSDTVQCSDMGPGSAAHRRSLAAPLVDTKFWAHGEQSALPLASRTRTLPRPPQARLANVTTTRSPLKDEPGWATHTSFPNFGNVKYFGRAGLTRTCRELVRCFARRTTATASWRLAVRLCRDGLDGGRLAALGPSSP